MSDGLTVTGGAGGISAQLEEVDAAAVQLVRSAEAIGDAVGALDYGRSALAAASGATTHLVSALDLEVDLLTVVGALLDAGLQARTLGSSAQVAVDAYRYADAEQQRTWLGLQKGVATLTSLSWGPVLRLTIGGLLPHADQLGRMADGPAPAGGGAAPASVPAAAAPVGDPRAAALTEALPPHVLRSLEGVGPADGAQLALATSAYPGALGPPAHGAPPPPEPEDPSTLGRDARERVIALAGAVVAGPAAVQAARAGVPAAAARVIEKMREQGLAGRTTTSVRPVPVPAAQAAAGPPRSTADLLLRVQQTGDGGGGTPGRVRVERQVAPSGASQAVLYLPGTETWTSASSRIPMDLTSNLEAAAGDSTAISDASVQALRAAGVTADDELLLVGHSLGGLAAAQMVSDPAFAAEFHPVALVTAGSPIGAFEIPGSVEVLALEHTDDVVPLLEGVRNRDTPTLTTVVADAPDGADHHSLAGYRQTAGVVDASDDPSLVAFRRRTASFLEATGSQVSDYAAERVR